MTARELAAIRAIGSDDIRSVEPSVDVVVHVVDDPRAARRLAERMITWLDIAGIRSKDSPR